MKDQSDIAARLRAAAEAIERDARGDQLLLFPQDRWKWNLISRATEASIVIGGAVAIGTVLLCLALALHAGGRP